MISCGENTFFRPVPLEQVTAVAMERTERVFGEQQPLQDKSGSSKPAVVHGPNEFAQLLAFSALDADGEVGTECSKEKQTGGAFSKKDVQKVLLEEGDRGRNADADLFGLLNCFVNKNLLLLECRYAL
jgi:hypothetical protein